MSERTKIAWTRSSWNPWIGCTEVSPGCDNCYARAFDNRHKLGGAAHWGAGVPRYRTGEANWKMPIRWNEKAKASGERWTVFPSMCDPFDNEVPMEWRDDLWRLIVATPNLTWLLLTKRIGNAQKMIHQVLGTKPPLPLWPNVCLGVSIVNQTEANRDIPKLLETPAAKRFVSYEPALGPVDWTNVAGKSALAYWVVGMPGGTPRRLDWVIVGGESSQGGAKARPFDLEWARSAVAQCKAAGVPVFVKQLGSVPYDSARQSCKPDMCMVHGYSYLKLRDSAGSDPAEWPEDLRVQELPA